MSAWSFSAAGPSSAKRAGTIWFGVCVYPVGILLLGMAIPGAWIGIAALVGFFILCKSIYHWNRLALILMLPLLVYKTSSFFSHVLIALGFFIPELGRYGEADLSPATYLIVTSLHFSVITTVVGLLLQRRELSHRDVTYRLPFELDVVFVTILLIVLGQVTVLLHTGLTAGFPMLTGTDRFYFRAQNAGGQFINILNYKSGIALLVGMFLASDKVSTSRKKAVAFAYLTLFTCYLAYGEKFHALLLTCALLLLPFIGRKPEMFVHYLGRAMPAISLVLGGALVLVYYVYSDYGAQPVSVTFERMFGRMAQQSQLWYIATRTFPGWFEFDLLTIDKVWQSLFMRGADMEAVKLGIGSYYYIFRFSPSSIQTAVYDMQGLVQFTQVSEAFWLSVSGLLGLILYLFLSGSIYAVIMLMLARSMAATNILLTYMWGSVFVTMMTSMNQALPHQIFGVEYLRWYLAAIFVHVSYHLLQKSAARHGSERR